MPRGYDSEVKVSAGLVLPDFLVRYLKCVLVASPLPVQVMYGSSSHALSSEGAWVLVQDDGATQVFVGVS